MWAQQFRGCFLRGKPEPDPNAHLYDNQRIRVGHYLVSRKSVTSGEWALPAGCDCRLCVKDRLTGTKEGK